MKKKEKIQIQEMTMAELNKELAICKKQATAFKIAFFTTASLIAAGMLSFTTLLGISADRSIKEDKALAKLVEGPKKEWILEESNKLLEEMKNDSNLTLEKLDNYNDKLSEIISISNQNYINKHGNDEIKTEYATIKAKYNEKGFFNAAMSCIGVTLAMAFPLGAFPIYWNDKKCRTKECQRQQQKLKKYDENLDKIFDETVKPDDIEQEYK